MPFRNPFRSKPRFTIKPEEEEFLIECFCYFGGRYGPIVPGAAPVTFDAAHFPQTFAAPNVQPGTVLADLRTILGIPTSLNISFDWLPDFSDAQLPHQEYGERALSVTHPSIDGSYRIDLRQVLQKQPGQLVHQLILETSYIRQHIAGEPAATLIDAAAPDYFILAAVYFGFGPLLSHHIVSVGRAENGGWERGWSHADDIDPALFTYAVAAHAHLGQNENHPAYAQLAPDTARDFTAALQRIAKVSLTPCTADEVTATDLCIRAERLEGADADLNSAALFREAAQLKRDTELAASAANNYGYALLLREQFSASRPYFEEAIQLDPNQAYPYDNLAYSYLRTNQPELAKPCLEQAAKREHAPGFHHRNWALYYLSQTDYPRAERHFTIAFQRAQLPVDQLDVHYAQLLLATERKEEAVKILRRKAEDGDVLAKRLLTADHLLD